MESGSTSTTQALPIPTASMRDKIVIVTGASSGIGKVTAGALASAGARVVMVCRPSPRADEAHREIARSGATVDLEHADLSSQAEIRSLAARLKDRLSRIDVLVNNAGAAIPERRVTADGLEATFATNHLSYFLLTTLLLDVLQASAPARIVNVASDAHRRGRINLEDLQSDKSYSSFQAYSNSKLANVLFTYELARRLPGTGVTANCLHPGVVRTGFGREYRGLMGLLWRIGSPFMISAERGAATAIHLASAPELAGVTGQYFQRRRAVASSPASRDPELARNLWEASERLTALR